MDEQLIAGTAYEANKPVFLAGINYKRGEPVNVSTLTPFKIAQLLNQRILRPATPASSAVDQPETGSS